MNRLTRRRSRLMHVPDHDAIDPARLREDPCTCGCTTWLLEGARHDRRHTAWRFRCPHCTRVLVTTILPRSAA